MSFIQYTQRVSIFLVYLMIGAPALAYEFPTGGHRYLFHDVWAGDKFSERGLALVLASAFIVDKNCDVGRGIRAKFISFLTDHHIPTKNFDDELTHEGYQYKIELSAATASFQRNKAAYCAVYLDLFRRGIAGKLD